MRLRTGVLARRGRPHLPLPCSSTEWHDAACSRGICSSDSGLEIHGPATIVPSIECHRAPKSAGVEGVSFKEPKAVIASDKRLICNDT